MVTPIDQHKAALQAEIDRALYWETRCDICFCVAVVLLFICIGLILTLSGVGALK